MADWGNGRLNFQPRINTDCAMEPGESGRGLPQSKAWRKFRAGRRTRSVLDCASPLALWNAAKSIPNAAGATCCAAIRWTCRSAGVLTRSRFARPDRAGFFGWRIAGRPVCADAQRLGCWPFRGWDEGYLQENC